MRNAVFASLVLFVAATQAACVCGGYDGQANRVYARNDTDMLILCDNGGFVATLPDRMVEGFYVDNTDGTGIATNGEDGQLAFDARFNADATLSTPQLGESPWTQMNLDKTALDHSDVLCQDLTNRTWWTAQ